MCKTKGYYVSLPGYEIMRLWRLNSEHSNYTAPQQLKHHPVLVFQSECENYIEKQALQLVPLSV